MYFKELGLRKTINNHPGSSKIIRKIRYLRFCSICDSLKTFFPPTEATTPWDWFLACCNFCELHDLSRKCTCLVLCVLQYVSMTVEKRTSERVRNPFSNAHHPRFGTGWRRQLHRWKRLTYEGKKIHARARRLSRGRSRGYGGSENYN